MSTADLDLLQGTLDVLVLKTLSWGPRHGYAVARWIAETTDDALVVDVGVDVRSTGGEPEDAAQAGNERHERIPPVRRSEGP